jgi:hypothetical protein
MLTYYVSIPIFMGSFIIGIAFTYILGPKKNIIYVYPNPDKKSTLRFRDNADNCFTYAVSEIQCSSNAGQIKQIPVQ